MNKLYQRAADGYPENSDQCQREAWGPIPFATRYQHGRYPTLVGYTVPAIVHGWVWSATFNRWSALVTFADGWCGYTFPEIATGWESVEA